MIVNENNIIVNEYNIIVNEYNIIVNLWMVDFNARRHNNSSATVLIEWLFFQEELEDIEGVRKIP